MASKSKWKNLIIENCKAVGTYKDSFLPVIETLSDILYQRDKVRKAYKDDGERPVIEFTNKAGATNRSKNPLLVLWEELNRSALSYWRDLGLTPAGLKKIDEKALVKKKESAIAKVLKDIG